MLHACTSRTLERQGIGAGSIIRRKADGGYECVTDEVAIEEPLEIRIGAGPDRRHDAHARQRRRTGRRVPSLRGNRAQRAPICERSRRCTLPASLGNVLNVTLAATVKIHSGRHATFRHDFHQLRTLWKDEHRIHPPTIPANRFHDAASNRNRDAARIAGTFAQRPGQFRSDRRNPRRWYIRSRGNLVVVREDIGRHNAVDKAIGRAFLDDLLPLKSHIMLVSGRSSLEIVQKALAAGIPDRRGGFRAFIPRGKFCPRMRSDTDRLPPTADVQRLFAHRTRRDRSVGAFSPMKLL